jgi:hypothetical protein
MARVRIKQLGDVVATSGLHFNMGPETRKLEPGEVVELPDDVYRKVKTSKAAHALEITDDPVTRPFTFASVDEAKFTSPTFRPRSVDDVEGQRDALAAVARRLAEVVPAPMAPDTDQTGAAVASARRQTRRAAREHQGAAS